MTTIPRFCGKKHDHVMHVWGQDSIYSCPGYPHPDIDPPIEEQQERIEPEPAHFSSKGILPIVAPIHPTMVARFLSYNLGTALTLLWPADSKGTTDEDHLLHMEQAIKYIQDEIALAKQGWPV